MLKLAATGLEPVVFRRVGRMGMMATGGWRYGSYAADFDDDDSPAVAVGGEA